MQLEKIKARVDELEAKKQLLIQAIGYDEFHRVVGVISKEIQNLNLDTTPTILGDLLAYVAEVNHQKCF